MKRKNLSENIAELESKVGFYKQQVEIAQQELTFLLRYERLLNEKALTLKTIGKVIDMLEKSYMQTGFLPDATARVKAETDLTHLLKELMK